MNFSRFGKKKLTFCGFLVKNIFYRFYIFDLDFYELKLMIQFFQKSQNVKICKTEI